MNLTELLMTNEFPIKDAGELIAFFAIGGGFLIAIISIVAYTIKSIYRTGQIERTRRDIAAYVAEGSITPQEGELMMRTAGTDLGAKHA